MGEFLENPEEPSQSDRGAQPWWNEGLHFECLGCGRCCRGAPGGIFLLPEEERRIAQLFGESLNEFRARRETNRWRFPSIRETQDGRCIMNRGDNRCKVYPCRPIACRTWPFWPELLASPEAWAAAAAQCPGMNGGPLWEAWKIQTVLSAHQRYIKKLSVACGKEAS